LPEVFVIRSFAPYAAGVAVTLSVMLAAPAALDGQAPAGADKVIGESDCTPARLGGAIHNSAIGEPVAGVTLKAPVWSAATATAPAQCVIDGAMAPVDRDPAARPIEFRVALPANWNHRAVHLGGGGMNGRVPSLAGSDPDLTSGAVRYGSDSGHQAGSSEWAINDESIKNFGYMQLKKTHDAAFVLIERMYGERPRYSYFVGTSQGGREGLTVAQRYPADYDGVASSVPVVNFTTLMLAPELIRIHERPVANWVTPAKTAAIRAEFMRQCDTLDGLVDGVINNYVACRAIFDLSSGPANRHPWSAKRCPNNIDPDPADQTPAACLTDGQISTLEMIYTPYTFPAPLAHGVRRFGMWLPTIDPSGSGLLQGARFRGQEGAPPDAPAHSALGILGVTGWLLQNLSANPLDFTEAAFARRRQQVSEWADATDPDLTAFSRRGGKLLVAIGAQDTLASPGAQLDYYQSLIDKMGRSTVDAFARLYVLPQGNHGMTAMTSPIDGNGKTIPAVRLPTTWSRMAPLVAWVEQKTPPDKMLTMTGGDESLPLCSYPTYPKYTSGPPMQASSYTCSQP
jgi:Tannase and feruloyl esterase